MFSLLSLIFLFAGVFVSAAHADDNFQILEAEHAALKRLTIAGGYVQREDSEKTSKIIFTFPIEKSQSIAIELLAHGSAEITTKLDAKEEITLNTQASHNTPLLSAYLEKGMHTLSIAHSNSEISIDAIKVTKLNNPIPQSSAMLNPLVYSSGVLGSPAKPVRELHNRRIYQISSQAELDSIISNLRLGDEIQIRNGDYNDISLIFPEEISSKKHVPIIIRPETAGGVRFRGNSKIEIHSRGIHFEGFEFLATGKHALRVFGTKNRITQNKFISCGDEDTAGASVLRIENGYNEIDHNFFAHTEGISIIMSQPARNSLAPSPKFNRFHHNTFQDIPHLFKNGGEAMMLGYGYAKADTVKGYDDKTFTIVEHNKFLRSNGDSEVVSIKSSKVRMRYNAFLDCGGYISFRMGENSRLIDNYISGARIGMLISGSKHLVTNNTFELRNSGTAIVLLDGTFDAETGLTKYEAATNNRVTNNDFYNAKTTVGYLRPQGELAENARRNNIKNNLYHP